MLKKFTVRNYRNFENEISIDFQDIAGYQFSTDCITDGVIGKMLIYGRNATGKTNLGKAIIDIKYTLTGNFYGGEGAFLNANSGSDTAFFRYVFQFGNQEVIYQYEKSASQMLWSEALWIDEVSIFHCDFLNKTYFFQNLSYIEAETANVERYMQYLEGVADREVDTDPDPGLPFLRWLINNVALKSDSIVIRLSDYVKRMVMMTVSNVVSIHNSLVFQMKKKYDNFFELLAAPGELDNFEEFLNAMGITCSLVLKKLPDGQQELYFSNGKLIPFYENASSGTISLSNLYRGLVSVMKAASFVYLDEFDAFYHYEMAENVIKFLKRKYPKSQIVLTSHNTNLMTNRLMRPDCLFILSGKGTLTALCHATLRELREGHNLEKMYISGEFEKYE